LLASAYAAAKVFVLPSLKEVMPLTVLEAVAAGCPVAVTKETAVQSLFSQYLVQLDPNSHASIREAVALAEKDGGSSKMRELLHRAYTWEAIGKKILHIYEDLSLGEK
jgi:glycosyltransferase involved in cell wall biosynthesis